MSYALSWFVVVLLLALWSLAAWALHTVAVWGLGSALLVVLGVGLHLLTALWRRRGGGSAPNAGPSLAAG